MGRGSRSNAVELVFTLNPFPADEYPTLPDMPPVAGKVGADLLAAAIRQVAVAAGKDDTLPALTGIRVEFDGPLVTLVATDSYRLAIREFKWVPAVAGTEATVLVPAHALVEAARSFGTARRGEHRARAHAEQVTASGIIGLGGRRTPNHHTAARRRVPKVRGAAPDGVHRGRGTRGGPVRGSGEAGRSGRGEEHPIRLEFTGTGSRWRRGRGMRLRRRRPLRPASTATTCGWTSIPRYLLDGLGAIDCDTARLSFTTPGPGRLC